MCGMTKMSRECGTSSSASCIFLSFVAKFPDRAFQCATKRFPATAAAATTTLPIPAADGTTTIASKSAQQQESNGWPQRHRTAQNQATTGQAQKPTRRCCRHAHVRKRECQHWQQFVDSSAQAE